MPTDNHDHRTLNDSENQADKLKQLFQEVNNESLIKENKPKRIEDEFIEIDVLKLPPRKEVHTHPKSRLSLSFKRPFIRISIVFILVIAILTTIYYVLGEELQLFF